MKTAGRLVWASRGFLVVGWWGLVFFVEFADADEFDA